MSEKSIEKYLVTRIVIRDNEVKFTDPKLFDKGILARQYIFSMNAEDAVFALHEVHTFTKR